MQKLAAVQDEDFNQTEGHPAIAPASRSHARRPLGLDHPGRASEGSAPVPGDAELHDARQGRSQRHSAAWRDPSRRTAGHRKTSLARGLAHRTAKSFQSGGFRLLEVEPHALTSSAMGKTQRAVSELFSQSIAEAAAAGPTIVLLDEVETLAADRSKMSLEANPIDIHRATDAVLVQLDALAEQHPNLLFLATSNFPQAVDAAFTSRCDLVMHVPSAGPRGLRAHLEGLPDRLGRTYPAIARLPTGADSTAAPPNVWDSTGAPSARWSQTLSPAHRRPR